MRRVVLYVVGCVTNDKLASLYFSSKEKIPIE